MLPPTRCSQYLIRQFVIFVGFAHWEEIKDRLKAQYNGSKITIESAYESSYLIYFKPSEIRPQINLNRVEEEVNNFF